MLAQDNEYLRETSNAMYELDQDRLIRQQCQAREDFLYWERIKENRNKRTEEQLAAANAELDRQRTELADKDAELADKDAELERQKAELAAKDAQIAELLARFGESNQ